MIRICFVCLGNICRSPMAEFIMKKKLKNLNIEASFYITSKATSYEETGNDIYPPAKEKLFQEEIPYTKHSAKRLELEDYDKYDYFICMEQSNMINARRIFQKDPKNKILKLLEEKDIADPWYTRNFDETYKDLDKGLDILINKFYKE